MNFEYNFQHIMPVEENGLLGMMIAVYLVVALAFSALGVISYVFQSMTLCNISSRRGIRKRWLAWLPVGNMWILGSIADHYQYVAKGQVCNRRKALLISMIAIYILPILIGLGFAGLWLDAFSGTVFADPLFCALLLVICGLLFLAVQIMGVVVQYIACYNLFASCNPATATTFLLLSIFVPVTLPFFLFASRNKDLGMPPKKQACIAPESKVQPDEPEADEDDFVL